MFSVIAAQAYGPPVSNKLLLRVVECLFMQLLLPGEMHSEATNVPGRKTGILYGFPVSDIVAFTVRSSSQRCFLLKKGRLEGLVLFLYIKFRQDYPDS